jgi:hypothetical protein
MVPLRKFTVPEVAEHFGVSKRYLSETARKKKLCGRAGRSLYFTEADIEALDKLWHGSGSTKGATSGGSTGPSLGRASERARERLFGKKQKLTPADAR